MARQVYIGTSGWMYKHWNKFFYPDNLKGKAQLPYFSKYFNTVEINNTFYHIPRVTASEGWYDQTPSEFQFAVKLNQYLTHRKRLILDEKSCAHLESYLKNIAPLKEKAKLLLVQLPPNFKANFERLEGFLAELKTKIPEHLEVACEFRHESWFKERLYQILRRYNSILVIATNPGKFAGKYELTSKSIYIRYHATAEKPDYSEKELDKWVGYIEELPAEIEKIYIYFNNDFEGWAITNAEYLKRRLAC